MPRLGPENLVIHAVRKVNQSRLVQAHQARVLELKAGIVFRNRVIMRDGLPQFLPAVDPPAHD
jgi:hypothetical protein